MGLCDAFLYDHCNVPTDTLTETSFGMRARNFVLQNSFLSFLHFELNKRLLNFVLQFASNGLFAPLTMTDLEKMLSSLVREIAAIQIGQNTPVSKAYDTWPLQNPAIVQALEEMSDNDVEFNHHYENLKEVFLSRFKPHLQQMKEVVHELLNNMSPVKDSFKLTSLASELIDATFSNEYYKLLVMHLCPTLLEFNFQDSVTQPQVLKKIKNALNIVDRVDTCVYCFRKRNYLNKELLLKCIVLEWEETTSDGYILYRGTNNLNDERPTILALNGRQLVPHSLSFGSGLFSGILHDKTAVPYNYFIKSSRKYGYALKVKKKDFLNQSEENLSSRLFYIPPLPTIVQLASIGEYFHPRGKVYIDPSFRKSTELFVSGILNCTARRLPEFLLTDNDSVNSYSKFVKTNMVVIKEP
jgi:hypothetical protein